MALVSCQKTRAQAILLGREWPISALCIAECVVDYRDRSHREIIEKQLAQMIGANANLNQAIARHVTSDKKNAAFWSTLTEYRNDIAHTQMRRTTISASTLQNYVENELVQRLSDLLPQFTA